MVSVDTLFIVDVESLSHLFLRSRAGLPVVNSSKAHAPDIFRHGRKSSAAGAGPLFSGAGMGCSSFFRMSPIGRRSRSLSADPAAAAAPLNARKRRSFAAGTAAIFSRLRASTGFGGVRGLPWKRTQAPRARSAFACFGSATDTRESVDIAPAVQVRRSYAFETAKTGVAAAARE